MDYKPKFPVRLDMYARSKEGLGSPYDSHTVNDTNEFNDIVTRYVNLKNIEIYDGGYRVFNIISENPNRIGRLTLYWTIAGIILATLIALFLAHKQGLF